MMIGLKSGTVSLYAHEKEWEMEAERTISRLKAILGDIIRDIQHVGSTSIPAIKAKPIIDIAVAVDHFDSVLACEKELNRAGFYTGQTQTSENNCSSRRAATTMARAICKRTLSTLSTRTAWTGSITSTFVII